LYPAAKTISSNLFTPAAKNSRGFQASSPKLAEIRLSALFIIAIKLALGLIAFLIIGYVGQFYDSRIAGILLTFPILNAVGILTGADPFAVADAISAVVVINGVLFYFLLSYAEFVPRFRWTWNPASRLLAQLAGWTLMWLVAAFIVTAFREKLPGAGFFLIMQIAITSFLTWRNWTPAPAPVAASNVPQIGRREHLRAFVFWATHSARFRVALFVVTCGIILAVAYSSDSKWVGMVSALPLPGFFALALLIDVAPGPRDLSPIRDTALFGPALIIVFNWLYAHVVAALPQDPHERLILGMLAAFVYWAVYAALIFTATSGVARRLDRPSPR
jgi:uncharacterized membrane protein (GlpM family)